MANGGDKPHQDEKIVERKDSRKQPKEGTVDRSKRTDEQERAEIRVEPGMSPVDRHARCVMVGWSVTPPSPVRLSARAFLSSLLRLLIVHAWRHQPSSS